MGDLEVRAILLALEYLERASKADRYSSDRDTYLGMVADILAMLIGAEHGSEVD